MPFVIKSKEDLQSYLDSLYEFSQALTNKAKWLEREKKRLEQRVQAVENFLRNQHSPYKSLK